MEKIVEAIVADATEDRLKQYDDAEKSLKKAINVYPKKDIRTGKAFFKKEDVDFLKRMKDIHIFMEERFGFRLLIRQFR